MNVSSRAVKGNPVSGTMFVPSTVTLKVFFWFCENTYRIKKGVPIVPEIKFFGVPASVPLVERDQLPVNGILLEERSRTGISFNSNIIPPTSQHQVTNLQTAWTCPQDAVIMLFAWVCTGIAHTREGPHSTGQFASSSSQHFDVCVRGANKSGTHTETDKMEISAKTFKL